MSRLEDLEAFLGVVEEGGLTAAGRHLRRSLQSISRSLMALEKSLGVELVRRTTRRSQPTEAGLAFYRRVKPAFGEINDAMVDAGVGAKQPSGTLHIAAPVLFAPAYVVPAVATFLARYPKVEVELVLSDQFVDLVGQGLDLAVRIGTLPDVDLKAKRIGGARRVIFGAPEYFARRGRPKRPEDLRDHSCVVRTTGGKPDKWPLVVGGKPVNIAVNGRFRADDSATLYAAVTRGLGLGFSPLLPIEDLVDRGVVGIVLAEFETPPVPIHALWPAAKTVPAKTRLFVDLLAKYLAESLI